MGYHNKPCIDDKQNKHSVDNKILNGVSHELGVEFTDRALAQHAQGGPEETNNLHLQFYKARWHTPVIPGVQGESQLPSQFKTRLHKTVLKRKKKEEGLKIYLDWQTACPVLKDLS